MLAESDWAVHGLCGQGDADQMFADAAAQDRAKATCSGCPVSTECLAYALDYRIEHGVWGGMSERERRSLLLRRPTVSSWRSLLEAARAEYEQQFAVSPQPMAG